MAADKGTARGQGHQWNVRFVLNRHPNDVHNESETGDSRGLVLCTLFSEIYCTMARFGTSGFLGGNVTSFYGLKLVKQSWTVGGLYASSIKQAAKPPLATTQP